MPEPKRTWDRIDEPEDVSFVVDGDGDLWQRARDVHWVNVEHYHQAGLPRVGDHSWGQLLCYGPVTELEVPE